MKVSCIQQSLCPPCSKTVVVMMEDVLRREMEAEGEVWPDLFTKTNP